MEAEPVISGYFYRATMVTAFQYFTVAGLINAVLLCVVLLLRKRAHIPTMYLLLLLLIVSFQAILNAFDNRDFFMAFPHLSKISWLTPSLFGPLVYLITVKMSSRNPFIQAKDLVHFIPFGCYLIILSPWYLSSAAVKRQYLSDFELASVDDFGYLTQLSIPLILAYLAAALIRLHKLNAELGQLYSELSHKRLAWMRTFVYAVLGILVVSALAFYGRKWQIPVVGWFYHYNYGLVVLLVYWIAYKSLSQPAIFTQEAFPHTGMLPLPETPVAETSVVLYSTAQSGTPAVKKYARSGLALPDREAQFARLKHTMETRKLYLDPDITIYQIADIMELKKHHLSQLINEAGQQNFFDFINSYRVEEAKRRLTDPAMQHLTILAIAMESGFNSKATFNAVFKKMTGYTPSGYQCSMKFVRPD
jgi:AraC-like DNA-binding protein